MGCLDDFLYVCFNHLPSYKARAAMTKQGKGTGKRKDKGTVLSHSGHFRLGECVSPGLKLRTFQETKFPQRLATLFCAFLLKMRDWEACTILHVVT